MSTTDIIPGIALTARCMTEVMEYIKKQDEEIKKLKQENGEIMDSLDKELGVERNLARDVRILVEENEELKTSIQTTTSYWTDSNELLKDEIKKLKKGNETYEDLLAGEKGLIDEINKLKEENKKLQEFCKRGRVAKKDSPLEEMFLREAGLMYHDDGETLVSSKKPQID